MSAWDDTVREIQEITGEKSETRKQKLNRAAWELHNEHGLRFRAVGDRLGCSEATGAVWANEHERLTKRRALMAARRGAR